MNRRSILALFGGAAAMPAAVGVKSAASALGLETALVGPSPVAEEAVAPGMGHWWGSPVQIAFDAQDSARYDLAQGNAYPHMKSWGRGFRTMAVERDHQIRALYRHKMESDEGFRAKVLAAFGVKA